VKVVDVNLLLYAINRDAPRHEAAKVWLERALSADEPVGFAWVVILGFLRLSTHPRVFPEPLTPEQALAVVDGWLSRPTVRTLNPGDGHWRLLKELLERAGSAGNLTTDAHLAAVAIEHGAELVSTDSDFARFRHLRWGDPLEG
jgi:toxin-antitoxin system PIN domain toxin